MIAAQGVKIIAKDLDHALAGLPMYVAQKPDEVDIYKVSAVSVENLARKKKSDFLSLESPEYVCIRVQRFPLCNEFSSVAVKKLLMLCRMRSQAR